MNSLGNPCAGARSRSQARQTDHSGLCDGNPVKSAGNPSADGRRRPVPVPLLRRMQGFVKSAPPARVRKSYHNISSAAGREDYVQSGYRT